MVEKINGDELNWRCLWITAVQQSINITLSQMAKIWHTFVIGSLCKSKGGSMLFAHTRGNGLYGFFFPHRVQLLGNRLYALEFPSVDRNGSVQPTHPTSLLSFRITTLLFLPPASAALSYLHSAHSLNPHLTCCWFMQLEVCAHVRAQTKEHALTVCVKA